MASDLLLQTTDGIAEVTLNRPAALNALTKRMKVDLAQMFHELAGDPKVRAIVLQGAGGRAFCAGSDIKEMSQFGPEEAESMLISEHECFHSILSCAKPVIAAVEGYALGAGCELAMCADIVVAAPSSTLGMPELKFGAVNGNETSLLLYIGGLPLLRKLILNCELVSALEGKELGLVSEIAENPGLHDVAMRHARRLGSYPGNAYRRQKELIRAWLDQTYSSAVESSIASAAMAWAEPEIRTAMSAALGGGSEDAAREAHS